MGVIWSHVTCLQDTVRTRFHRLYQRNVWKIDSKYNGRVVIRELDINQAIDGGRSIHDTTRKSHLKINFVLLGTVRDRPCVRSKTEGPKQVFQESNVINCSASNSYHVK